MILGLIPDCVLEQVTSAGNAAGNGARIALMNADSRFEIESMVHNVEKIETAVEPKFQEHFVEAMAFPHKSDPFTQLGSVVDLPERSSSEDKSKARGRKSRRRKRA